MISVCGRERYQKKEKLPKKPENPLKFESVIFAHKTAFIFTKMEIFSAARQPKK